MEHTRTTPIATPAQRQALIRNQVQRLRDQAEALLRAVEAIEPPKTYVEAERAGKALLVVGKVLEAAHAIHDEDLRIASASVRHPDPLIEREALNSWTAILDSSLEALALARKLNRDQAAKTG